MSKETGELVPVGQPRIIRLLLGVRKDTVWHQDSPGVRVDVIRNNLTRLWRSPEFSEVGETHYLPTVLPPSPMPINRRIHLPNTNILNKMENEIEAKNVDEQGASSHREQRLVLLLNL